MAKELWCVAEVQQRTRLSPHLVRVRLQVPAGLAATGVPDERVVLELPGGATRSLTVRARNGAQGVVDLDVVLHPAGVAAAWAERAQPGDQVRVSDPRGWYAPPPDTSWQLLVADLSGLPALARISEETAAALPTSALVEVPDPADRPPLPGSVGVRWVPEGLPAAVADVGWPPGPGYVWFAGEAADARAVRRHLRDLGWPVARYRVLGYWRAAQTEWERRFTEVAPGLEHVYTDAVAHGLTSDEALEAYDDALADLGL
ncbi:siderophore-interacting protein [uncultured Friedmanniella sp.]|uniref:siderophore-interacting protein n=1 Tax=uncultured Friedmanniella sp. TaxID=335381 RepID=UPI0035C9543C